MEENCHICNSVTDFYCRDCGQPVCEECCVPMTYHNQIDYTLCLECNDSQELAAAEENLRRWKAEEELKAKKEKLAKARRERYWRPENVAKRKAKKEARLLERAKLEQEQAREAAKIVGEMFRGMF